MRRQRVPQRKKTGSPTAAMGQERRIGGVRNISALPPRADVGADIVERPLCANRGHCRRSPNGIYGISSRDRLGYSGLTPANLITLAHFSVSSAMSFPKSADVIGI